MRSCACSSLIFAIRDFLRLALSLSLSTLASRICRGKGRPWIPSSFSFFLPRPVNRHYLGHREIMKLREKGTTAAATMGHAPWGFFVQPRMLTTPCALVEMDLARPSAVFTRVTGDQVPCFSCTVPDRGDVLPILANSPLPANFRARSRSRERSKRLVNKERIFLLRFIVSYVSRSIILYVSHFLI